MSTKHPSVTLPKDTPCGCIHQAGAGGKAEAGAGAGACCAQGCRCAELKGKCGCAERLAAHETTVMGKEQVVPMGCVVEAGATGAPASAPCGVRGCRCIDIKGRCDCGVEAK